MNLKKCLIIVNASHHGSHQNLSNLKKSYGEMFQEYLYKLIEIIAQIDIETK